jgi:Carbohydrate-selective porin, OprB family
VTLGPQQLPGLYKIGGSYDTSPLSDWLTATNGLPLPLTTAPPRKSERETFYVLGQQKIWQPDSSSGRSNGGFARGIAPDIVEIEFNFETLKVRMTSGVVLTAQAATPPPECVIIELEGRPLNRVFLT